MASRAVAANGVLDPGFNPGTANTGTDGSVQAIVVQPDGKIVITGLFTKYNGITRNRIARLNQDGTPDLTFDPGTGAETGKIATEAINALARQSDGRLVIGGDFTLYDGVARVCIARASTPLAATCSCPPFDAEREPPYRLFQPLTAI